MAPKSRLMFGGHTNIYYILAHDQATVEMLGF